MLLCILCLVHVSVFLTAAPPLHITVMLLCGVLDGDPPTVVQRTAGMAQGRPAANKKRTGGALEGDTSELCSMETHPTRTAGKKNLSQRRPTANKTRTRGALEGDTNEQVVRSMATHPTRTAGKTNLGQGRPTANKTVPSATSPPKSLQRSKTRTWDVTLATDFSGMETPRIALQNTGFTVKQRWTCDLNQSCRRLVERTWGDADFSFADITKRDPHTLPNDIELYIAGVPCQPWAKGGGQAGLTDPKGRLWKQTCETVSINKPKALSDACNY